MSCPRCGGLMVDERFCELLYEAGRDSFEGMRCLLCGEILDPVIMMNRMSGIFRPLTPELTGCSMAAPAPIVAADWEFDVRVEPAMDNRNGRDGRLS